MHEEPRMSSTNFAGLYKSVERSDHTLLIKRFYATLGGELHRLSVDSTNKDAKIRAMKILEGLLYGLDHCEATPETDEIHRFCLTAMKTLRNL